MDFFNQTLLLGDRVAFITNRGVFQWAQIVDFVGEAGPYQQVRLYTLGKRYTTVRCTTCIKEPV